MRTGSIGNRTVEDIVKTLVEPKKTVIQSIRQKLLSQDYSEEVEFDAIEIEPVMIYSISGKRRIFLKHKWNTVALVLMDSRDTAQNIITKFSLNPSNLEANEEDGTTWLRFELPAEENQALNALAIVSSV